MCRGKVIPINKFQMSRERQRDQGHTWYGNSGEQKGGGRAAQCRGLREKNQRRARDTDFAVGKLEGLHRSPTYALGLLRSPHIINKLTCPISSVSIPTAVL